MGTAAVTRPPTIPRFEAGHELLHQRKIHAVQAPHSKSNEETKNGKKNPGIVRRERQNAGGNRKIDHRHEKNLAAPDLVRKPAVKYGAEHRSKSRGKQNDGGLAERELPGPGDKSHNVADEKVIEEFEHVAQNRGGNDPALIARQPFLLLEVLEHVGFGPAIIHPVGQASVCLFLFLSFDGHATRAG